MTFRKVILALLVLLSAGVAVSGQSRFALDKNHLNISAYGRYSHVLDGQGIYNQLLSSYNSFHAGVELGIDTHPSDSSWWSKALNYPHLGIGFSYEHTGALAVKPGSSLGSFYNLYGSMQFDMVRAGWFSLAAIIDVGLSYTPHRYHYYSNPGNVYIGSNVLADIGAGLEAKFRFLPQWELALGAYLNHHSNGMTRVPNIGINQASAGARLRYYMAPQENMERQPVLARPDYPKGWHYNIYLAGGVHSCDVERRAAEVLAERGETTVSDDAIVAPRLRALLGFEAEWRYHPLLSTGIGLEGNYAVNRYRETDLALEGREDPRGYSPFYASVHLIQHLHYQNFSIHVGWGAYVFRKTGLTEDMGWNFQRVGARYILPEFSVGRMYLGFDMRAHFLDRSYCLEWTIGYKI